MKKSLRIFLRVLRAYTLEEKVLSIIIAGAVFFLSVQGFFDLFHLSGTIFDGGIYSEALISDKATILNPLFADISEANHDLNSLIFSGLTKYDPEKKAFVDDMASLKISPDGIFYKFTLKQNLKWHDGKPVTIDDVYFTYHDVIQNPAFQNPFLQLNFAGIDIQKVDSQTLQFQLKKPNSFFITNTNVGILPKHILADVPVKDLLSHPFNFKPIGSGPYKVDSAMEVTAERTVRVTLENFDYYYAFQPKIEQIRFTVYPDEESLLKEKNTFNVISKVPSSSVAEFKKSNRFTFSAYELPQYLGVFFNLDRPLLKKKGVRVALLKAVDKSQLLKLFPDKIAVDTPLLELNQSEWIYKPNLQEANGALFDAGYKLDKSKNDGKRRDSKGNVLQLTLLTRAYNEGSPLAQENKNLTDFLKKSWSDIGIDLKIDFVDGNEFDKRLATRNYDLILTGQHLGYNLDTYSYWHSSQANANGLNLSNYKSFSADQIIERIRNTFDNAKKEQSLKELAKVLADDIPAILLYRPRYTFASDGKVKGITLQNFAFSSDRFVHIDRWCIDCKMKN
jgi:peptide/nickel transport system substrate-binding protein